MNPAIGFFVFSMIFVSLVRSGNPCGSDKLAGGDNLTTRLERIQREREEKDRFLREDPRSPLRSKDQKRFKGLAYYPIDLGYVLSGRLERDPKGRKEYVKLPTNRGNFRTYIQEGVFRFKIEGKEFALTVYRSLGRSTAFLPFKDGTNGHETYKNGRYVDVEIVRDDEIVIDFNRAYNPFCAYNPKYTCAYASEENTLDLAIPSGEKKFIPSP
jgi:uncharacterized protein (DUF1684 family)